PWAITKSNVGCSKKGRTPLWYTWLFAQTVDNQNLPSNSKNWHPITLPPSMDKRKKKWVFFTDTHYNFTVGRISYKSASTNRVVITHWTISTQPFVFIPCRRCASTSWISVDNFCQIYT